jgi:Ca2+-binding RTX toxin-like protein
MARFTGSRFNDRINGTRFRDNINGGAGNDHLNGKGGNDVVNGGAGNDHVSGGTGFDKLFGGKGHDVFQFHNGDGFGGDIVKDYVDGSDKFDIPSSVALPFGQAYSGPLGTGLIVTYHDANGINSGDFLVLGYSLAQFSLDDFI